MRQKAEPTTGDDLKVSRNRLFCVFILMARLRCTYFRSLLIYIFVSGLHRGWQ